MYCPNCGTEVMKRSRYCSNCGQQMKKTSKLLILLLSFMTVVVATVGVLIVMLLTESKPTKVDLASKEVPILEIDKVEEEEKEEEVESEPEPEEPVTLVVKEQVTEPPKSVSEIIHLSQPKVFTIFTQFSQGSGFLINTYGDVLTNAHVVEGSLNPIVKTIDGGEFEGTLIGYCNTTDIALIRVPDLANREALPLETAPAEIGDEVIALGSPQGFENTATLGNISGVDRTFIIEPFYYEGIYQTSAAIAPGSSGGPLVSKSTGKVLAINSARHTTETHIGFSIPMYQIINTVNQWVDTPLSTNAITSMFYYQDGMYYYQDYMDDYGYFEDGMYDDDYTEYDEIPYEDFGYDEETNIESEAEYDKDENNDGSDSNEEYKFYNDEAEYEEIEEFEEFIEDLEGYDEIETGVEIEGNEIPEDVEEEALL